MCYQQGVRVVVDTNVLVAAVSSPSGASREVIRRCLLYDAETRFRALAARGSVEEGLRILDKLDAAFARTTGTEGDDSR